MERLHFNGARFALAQVSKAAFKDFEVWPCAARTRRTATALQSRPQIVLRPLSLRQSAHPANVAACLDAKIEKMRPIIRWLNASAFLRRTRKLLERPFLRSLIVVMPPPYREMVMSPTLIFVRSIDAIPIQNSENSGTLNHLQLKEVYHIRYASCISKALQVPKIAVINAFRTRVLPTALIG